MIPSLTHLVIIPTFNTGPRLAAVVAEVLRHWQPVQVVVDGSTDGSEQPVRAMARDHPALTVLVLPHNAGKGAATLAGSRAALARGFTHALVMDADGQHPAASIAGFMAASQAHPEAQILGRPVFPANIPAARLHGRKLSVGLVRLELLGPGIADPLFGFRVYPLAPLVAVLGSVRGGRRYDFDTEAAVRLGWSGVPPQNLAAPVRYFSRAEGGVSHFHYVRDNATLVWLHLRLLTELVFLRWPALLRHRRRWSAALALVACLLAAAPAHRGEAAAPASRLAVDPAAWQDLTAVFAGQTDVTADFAEHRHFAFRPQAVELTGEVRISAAHGLSLHYLTPEVRTVILDAHGMLMRTPSGKVTATTDPRAEGAKTALLQILRLDLAALVRGYELYGERHDRAWTLDLVPRPETSHRGLIRITVDGEAAAIRRIVLHRSAKNAIEILIAPPRPPAAFTSHDLQCFFR